MYNATVGKSNRMGAPHAANTEEAANSSIHQSALKTNRNKAYEDYRCSRGFSNRGFTNHDTSVSKVVAMEDFNRVAYAPT